MRLDLRPLTGAEANALLDDVYEAIDARLSDTPLTQ